MFIKKGKVFDVTILLLWTVIATFLMLYVLPAPGAYVPTFLYFVLPTAYLVLKYKPHFSKMVAGSLLVGVLIPLSFDLLAQLNGSWVVPFDTLLIPFLLFGFYPVDELVWFFLLAAYTLVFYESCVDDERTRRLSKNFKVAALVWVAACIVTLCSVVFLSEYLLTTYSYLIIFVPFTFPPILYVLYTKSRLIKKFIVPTAFFFFVALNFEIVGLTFGYWVFSSEYIGWLSVFGRFFPFEEFLFWILLYPATALSYYELLVDDSK
jgi:hypothetical protein